MMKSALSILFIIVIFYKYVSGYKRVCYYTNWSQYRPTGAKFTPDDIDPSLCSHIIYAFGKLQGNRLVAFEWNDESTEWSLGMYAKVNNYKKTNPGLKTLLAVGGWNAGSPPFSDMTRTEASRREFVNSTLHYLRDRDFDGLDMDWEYPTRRGGRPEDKANLVHLLAELKQAFEQESYHTGRPRLLLTAAVPAGKSNVDTGYDVPKVVRSLDFVNIMSYDLHGSWDPTTGLNSPLYGRANEDPVDATLNMDWAIKYWLKNGAPKHKLIVGIGFHGRSFKLQSALSNGMGAKALGAGRAGKYTREPGFMAYYEVCEELKKGASRVWHAEHRAPYIYKDDLWVGYDDEKSVREKVRWMKNNKFGGIMIWSLALDDFTGQFCNRGRYPLLTTINEELGVTLPRGRPSRQEPTLTTDLVSPPQHTTQLSNHPTISAAPLTPDLPLPNVALPDISPVATSAVSNSLLEAPIANTNLNNQPISQALPSTLDGTIGTLPNTNFNGVNMLPEVISDPGQKAMVLSNHVAPIQSRQTRSHNTDIDRLSAPTSGVPGPNMADIASQLASLPMSLAHDHPPEIVPIGHPPAVAGVMHHAQPVPDDPLLVAQDAGGIPHSPIFMASDVPMADAIHAGPVMNVQSGVPMGVAIEAQTPDVNIVDGGAIMGAVMPSGPVISQVVDTGPSVAGIPLSAVRPAPPSNPVKIQISSSSNSSSSSSSSKSESKTSSINFGPGDSSVASTLRELLDHHNPTASSSSSSSASSGSVAPPSHGHAHDDRHQHIPVSVVSHPNDISMPPGSRVEAVIPINSIDNLAEVLASLGTSVPSSGTVMPTNENSLLPGQVMQELDLANLLGIDPVNIQAASDHSHGHGPHEVIGIPDTTIVALPDNQRSIPRSRQVFRSPVVEARPVAQRTGSASRDLQRQLLLQRLQDIRNPPVPRPTTRRPDVDQRTLADLRARRIAVLRARQQAALRRQQEQQRRQRELQRRQQEQQRLRQQQQQQQRRRTINLNQLSDTQLRRLINRLDGQTLQRLIGSGRITLSPNIERPRTAVLATAAPPRAVSSQDRRLNLGSGTLRDRRVTRPSSTRTTGGTRFVTTRVQPQGSSGRRVVFLNADGAVPSRRTTIGRSRDRIRRTLPFITL